MLGEKLYGVYLYGAVAFPESGPLGDVDFHVILSEALTEEEKSALWGLYETLSREFPPMGAKLDGHHILLDDARRTAVPRNQLITDVFDTSWALHCAHIRAGRCIVLHGPDPMRVYPQVSWPELEAALDGELKYVQDHLDVYPDYCILNLCRLMYSFETQDVAISKIAAAEWAGGKYPDWKGLIETARRSYARQVTAQEAEFMKSEVPVFYRFACERMRESVEQYNR